MQFVHRIFFIRSNPEAKIDEVLRAPDCRPTASLHASDTRPNALWMAVTPTLLCTGNENKVTKFDLRSENGEGDAAAEVYHLPWKVSIGFPGQS